jgi:hypothetical protein
MLRYYWVRPGFLPRFIRLCLQAECGWISCYPFDLFMPIIFWSSCEMVQTPQGLNARSRHSVINRASESGVSPVLITVSPRPRLRPDIAVVHFPLQVPSLGA